MGMGMEMEIPFDAFDPLNNFQACLKQMSYNQCLWHNPGENSFN